MNSNALNITNIDIFGYDTFYVVNLDGKEVQTQKWSFKVNIPVD